MASSRTSSAQTQWAFRFAVLAWGLEIFGFTFLNEPVQVLPFVLLSVLFGSIMASLALYYRQPRTWQLIFALVSFLLFLTLIGLQIWGIYELSQGWEDWD